MKKTKNEKRETPHENTDPDYNKVQKRAIDKSNKLVNREETLAKRLEYEEVLHAAYKSVFTSPDGQIILRDLEKNCRFHQSCYAPDSNRHTDFNLGRQSVIIGIHENIKGKQ